MKNKKYKKPKRRRRDSPSEHEKYQEKERQRFNRILTDNKEFRDYFERYTTKYIPRRFSFIEVVQELCLQVEYVIRTPTNLSGDSAVNRNTSRRLSKALILECFRATVARLQHDQGLEEMSTESTATDLVLSRNGQPLCVYIANTTGAKAKETLHKIVDQSFCNHPALLVYIAVRGNVDAICLLSSIRRLADRSISYLSDEELDSLKKKPLAFHLYLTKEKRCVHRQYLISQNNAELVLHPDYDMPMTRGKAD